MSTSSTETKDIIISDVGGGAVIPENLQCIACERKIRRVQSKEKPGLYQLETKSGKAAIEIKYDAVVNLPGKRHVCNADFYYCSERCQLAYPVEDAKNYKHREWLIKLT